jgi:hypothetical protein
MSQHVCVKYQNVWIFCVIQTQIKSKPFFEDD